jgi:hypothetical protein
VIFSKVRILFNLVTESVKSALFLRLELITGKRRKWLTHTLGLPKPEKFYYFENGARYWPRFVKEEIGDINQEIRGLAQTFGMRLMDWEHMVDPDKNIDDIHPSKPTMDYLAKNLLQNLIGVASESSFAGGGGLMSTRKC